MKLILFCLFIWLLGSHCGLVGALNTQSNSNLYGVYGIKPEKAIMIEARIWFQGYKIDFGYQGNLLKELQKYRESVKK